MRRDQRESNARYYAEHRTSELERVRSRQRETREFLRRARQRPCSDCGKTFEAHQMDFDHRDSASKSFRLTSGAAMLMSRPRLIAEIAKCDVVCANCHRVRTWLRHSARLAAARRSASLTTARKRAAWQAHANLLDRLRDTACADCGDHLPPCAMDFDHRDATEKSATVTRMIGRAGTARILAEAAKCDIVCANCHRARTDRRRAVQHSERE